MKKFAISIAIFAASAMSQAFSFAGDWTFNSDATLNYNTTIASGAENYLETSGVTATQSTINDFAFPLSFSGFSGQGDFVVTGNTVTDINSGQTTDPFDVPFGSGTVSVRLTYPTWNLTGTVDGVNAGIVDGFGDRAYHITGDTVTISNVQIEAFLFGGWQDLGTNNNIVVNSWSLEREAVPEPATLSILGLAALAAFKKRKRN